MFFEQVPLAPPDAVFGMVSAFRADPRPSKVDLLVGIFKDENLQAELMPSVRKAKEQILPEDCLADYFPIDGSVELIESIGRLVFGDALWKQEQGRIAGAQMVGGTGALRLGAEFLGQEVSKVILVPQPTWANHAQIFERAGLSMRKETYYSRDKKGFDSESFLRALEELPKKSAVLLHACCHNPTGSDPTEQEWKKIAEVCKRQELIPFFDFAYQGFGDGLEQDARAVRHVVQSGLECVIAYSCSKNFSLYCQRVGALFVVGESVAVKPKVASQIRRMIRAIYSNPPAHGMKIVTHILNGPLYKQWEHELGLMRDRIQSTRKDFVQRLLAESKGGDFHHLLNHKGMFSFMDLEKPQVEKLISEHGVYLQNNGRLSITGLNRENLNQVVRSLLAVMGY